MIPSVLGSGGGGTPPTLDIGLQMSADDAVITIPNSGKGLEALFENEFTIVFDAIITDPPASGHLFSKGDGTPAQAGVRGLVSGAEELMSSYQRVTGFSQYRSDNPITPTYGSRHTYGFVMGDTDPVKPGAVGLYIDGSPIPQSQTQTGSGAPDYGAGFPLRIGTASDGSMPIPMILFGFTLYTGRLTIAEMADRTAPAVEAKLFARWNLNEGTGTVAGAVGPAGPVSGLNGVIANAPWVDENGDPV